MTLAEVIAQVESGGRSDIPRFEDAMFARWRSAPSRAQAAVVNEICRVHRGCSIATGFMITCTSWGKYQFLGETLYSTLDVTDTVFAFVASDAEQDARFDQWLGKHRFDASLVLVDAAETRRFAELWNGPGAVDNYLAQMAAVIGDAS